MICLALVLPTVGCVINLGDGFGGGPPARYKRTKLLEVQHVPGSALHVDSKMGGVTVTRALRDNVRIEAKIRCTTPERLETTGIVARTDAEGALWVSVDWPEGGRKKREGCEFIIETPGAHDVDIDTSYGGVTVSGLSGKAELRSSYGSISVSDHDGPVQARTSYGGIRVTNAAGPLDLDTSYGAVNASMTDDNPGPVRIDTSYGGVHLKVGRAFAGKLAMRTSYGSIDLNGVQSSYRPVQLLSMKKTAATVMVGDAGKESRLETSYGGISVDLPGDL